MATTTAAGRRAEARIQYDAFMDQCKSRLLLDRLTDKWVTLVLCTLGERDMRYSEVSRRIAGVSQKMLTQTLRSLERDGLVTRTVTPTVPVTVEYGITDLGRSLLAVVGQMKDWAEQHMDEVQAHRDEHDQRSG